MKVEALYVCHFRNLKSQQITPCASLNEFVGNNAQGKTAVLEAFHVLILGGSFRTYLLRELVQHGEKEFFIEGEVNNGGVHKTISLRYDGVRRYVSIDGELQDSTCMLLGNLLGVTATLEDHELVFGAPSIRRRFLDEQIAQIDPFYVAQLSRYSRALAARNRLLKMRESRTIGAWEEQLAKSAAYIVHQRRHTIDLLAPKVINAYHALFPEEPDSQFSMKYLTQCPVEEETATWYQHQFAQRREQEMKATVTLIGPHRDDIEWTIDERLCKSVASLGQARSVALALRCAEWELLAQRSREKPLFLIDDVESTLDATRKNVILQLCRNFEQVFFTCHVSQSLESRLFHITDGLCN